VLEQQTIQKLLPKPSKQGRRYPRRDFVLDLAYVTLMSGMTFFLGKRRLALAAAGPER
jgi:hypothetical protein